MTVMIEREMNERVPRIVGAAILAAIYSFTLYWALVGLEIDDANPWQGVAFYLLFMHLFTDWKADKYKALPEHTGE